MARHLATPLPLSDDDTIGAAGVGFQSHRTLRVPDTKQLQNLPPVRHIPLMCSSRLPDAIRSKGGFIMVGFHFGFQA
jgi:hypothetical protein